MKTKSKPSAKAVERHDERPAERRQDALKPVKSPFHGRTYSDHPQDPFRNLFGKSSLRFEF